jgi:hypothetical protein
MDYTFPKPDDDDFWNYRNYNEDFDINLPDYNISTTSTFRDDGNSSSKAVSVEESPASPSPTSRPGLIAHPTATDTRSSTPVSGRFLLEIRS